MDGANEYFAHALPVKDFSLRLRIWWYTQATAAFLERHLARKGGALIALLSGLVFTAALVTQGYVYLSTGRDATDLMMVDPMNATISWLFMLANLGLSLVVIGTAATVLGRFPLAAFIGMSWVLASLGAGILYNALATPVFSTGLCGVLGMGGALIDHTVVGDEVVRTCLVFLQDVTEMIGAAMLGAVVIRLERRARIVGFCVLAMAAWSLFDLMASACFAGPIVYWTEFIPTVLCALQCALSGAWFWSRSRTDSGGHESASESELHTAQQELSQDPAHRR